MKRTLSIIGGGKVGRTLGYLLAKAHCFSIKDIACQHLSSSITTQTFIGEGRAVADIHELEPVDSILIAVKDDQLPFIVHSLQTSKCLADGIIIFHVSGSFSHEILLPLKAKGAYVASIHPLKSFSDHHIDINTFNGTYCSLEGEDLACDMLTQVFKAIGANIIEIHSENKLLYHTATIFSSNYFVAIIEIALQLFEKTGISREEGINLLEPLVLGAWNQIKILGTGKALTGPISRGDSELIKRQFDQLIMTDKKIAAAYKALGEILFSLAIGQGKLSGESISKLQSLFSD